MRSLDLNLKKPTVSGPQSVTGQRGVKTDVACDFAVQDVYRMAAGSSSLEDIYRRRESVFGLLPFLTYPRTEEERVLHRLIYCTKYLPSPIFKMERLMPTNRAAQRKYLPWPWDEEEPKTPPMMDGQLSEFLKEEVDKMEPEESEDREEDGHEEDNDEEEEEHEEEDNSEEDVESMKVDIEEVEENEEDVETEEVEDNEEDEENEEEELKIVEEVKETTEKVSMKMRRVQHQAGRRCKIRQHSPLHYIHSNLGGKRNIIWTILLRPMCR
ncbi:uncharacterized protein LOC142741740 [Rhinoderma darwinii]|uniref:uncharacterized protein LOC142741740 n=1 Tax=Rhinoderma darwinii TaxID=43563 RepID=UPI003F6613FF